jgi:hypothetical protein
MKIVAKTRKLKSPQTTNLGKTRTNKEGQPVYTEYLDMDPITKREVVNYMNNHIERIVKSISQAEDFEIFDYTGIDIRKCTQQDNEPIAYSFIGRLTVLVKRLDQDDKDLTTGLVDMYNRVVTDIHTGIGTPGSKIEKYCIQVEAPGLRQIKSILNPDLFE